MKRHFKYSKGLVQALLFGTSFAFLTSRSFSASSAYPANTARRAASVTKASSRLSAEYARLPLSFEVNNGQTDPQVKFLARGKGYHLFLTPAEAVLTLRNEGISQIPEGTGQRISALRRGSGLAPDLRNQSVVLRLKLVGANLQPPLTGLEPFPGKVNYFIGNDPKKWRTNIPAFAKVKYSEVYPGIDLVYYGNEGNLEFDFLVAPGANPRAVKLAFEGSIKLDVDIRGDLRLGTGADALCVHRPRIYQEVDGVQREVSGRFILKENQQVGFEIGEYNPVIGLVIDPTLGYATYLGGSQEDECNAVAVDSHGRIYVTGQTASSDFPASNANRGNRDAFVTVIDPSVAGVASRVWSIYLGGGESDDARGIAVRESSSGTFVYVTGTTDSRDFPTTSSAFQKNLGGIQGFFDAFVTMISPDGNNLVYSTLLGGRDSDVANAIQVDSFGNAYVTGRTDALLLPGNFPVKNGFKVVQISGDIDAFVTKLNSTGSGIIYSSYLGGHKRDEGTGIAVLNDRIVFVAGNTVSGNFPVKSSSSLPPLQGAQGGKDAFVVKVDTGSTGDASLIYSTFLGGTGDDDATAIAVDAFERAYVTGETFSSNFPLVVPTGGTLTNPFRGGGDAFVAKLNADGTRLFYSFFLGGTGEDRGEAITLDSSGVAYITGSTQSKDDPGTPANEGFPLVNSIQSTLNGPSDAFVTAVNSAGTALAFSTYLGGSGDDQGLGIAQKPEGTAFSSPLFSSHSVFVAGSSSSIDFLTPNGFQTSPAGAGDGFVVKILSAVGAGLTGSWKALTQACNGSKPTCLLQGGFEVKNVGIETAANSVIKFYLSTDASLDESDQLLTQVSVGTLQPNETKTRNLRVKLGGSASGMFVIAFVDANDDVAEPNENNNIIVSDPIP